MNDLLCHTEFTQITPAKDLEVMWNNFDPLLLVNPESPQYIQRKDRELQRLFFDLKHSTKVVHAFLCGHRGSGKTTELSRLCLNKDIIEKYHPLYLKADAFGGDAAHLTVDAVFLEIGRRIVALKDESGKPLIPQNYENELNDWGQRIVKTMLGDQKVEAQAGGKADWWLAFFKAQLKTRREWKYEQKQIFEPKILDLIGLIQRMAQEIKNRSKRQLLVLVDDLEKGESQLHKDMHKRLFQENYDLLVQPNFSVIYTLPVYFRATPDRRIPGDQLYAFSAVRIYSNESKSSKKPGLDETSDGYQLMYGFVKKRVFSLDALCDAEALADLLRIGGGLFRETARAIREAAYLALVRGGGRIEKEDAEEVFNQVKKQYQPMIRGEAIKILKAVDQSRQGWVDGVEPYLQSRAVVEYENGDLWLDLRYVLKAYVRGLE